MKLSKIDILYHSYKGKAGLFFSLLSILFIVAVFASCGKESPAKSTPGITKVSGNETIKLPLIKISDGRAHFFQYAHDGKKIKFFVLKSSDGVVRAAFDACDVCWRAGKGYYQQDDMMVCRNCGRRFASDRINEVQGGCNPAPLERKISGENLEIKASDIKSGVGYFDL